MLHVIARGLALLGGTVLVAMIVLTSVSIIGRALIFAGLGPVPGDFELMEMGCAFAVFAFLPWCQLRRGHVTVDIVMGRFGRRANRLIDAFSSLLMTGAAVIVALQLFKGAADKASYGETTWILQLPLWWGYAGALLGAVMLIPVSAYTIWRDLHDRGPAA